MSSSHTLLKNPAFCNQKPLFEDDKAIIVERGTLLENRHKLNSEVYIEPLTVWKAEKTIFWIITLIACVLIWKNVLQFLGVIG